MSYLTSQVMADQSLAPAMDAQVHNADQARIIHDPSPQIDSLTELLAEAMRNALEMARLLSDLAASNGMELDCEQMIAGFADDVAAALRHCEHNTPDGPLSGRELANVLAEHLDAILADPLGPDATRSLDALRELFAAIPRAVLFSATVTHHLRPRRARALDGAYKGWSNRRAARDARQVVAS